VFSAVASADVHTAATRDGRQDRSDWLRPGPPQRLRRCWPPGCGYGGRTSGAR
jgi:hypothetical protein